VVAAVREEELRLASGAVARALDRGHSGLMQGSLRGSAQIEAAVHDDVVSEALAERTGNLFANLVAAGSNPWPDRRRERPFAERPGAGGHDSL
jgi:hypothetical protein